MKISFLFLLATFSIALISCKDDDSDTPTNQPTAPADISYRQEMSDFVVGISNYAKEIKPGFLVIPQNGIELMSYNGEADGPAAMAYLNAIDAVGQEDLNYGYDDDNVPTPFDDTEYMNEFLNIAIQSGKTVLVTDYCSAHSKMDNSYTKNADKGYISFAANHRELNNIPNYPVPVYNENNQNINKIKKAKNFLYLINPEKYNSNSALIAAVSQTNYDLLIIDLFDNDNVAFTASEINQLKVKANGGKRLVICYMSIGEAEDYRYYWNSDWLTNPPEWLNNQNPHWHGNFKVRYWYPEWQSIIYGNDDSYTKKILDADFDGVYLDIIDAFEYYE